MNAEKIKKQPVSPTQKKAIPRMTDHSSQNTYEHLPRRDFYINDINASLKEPLQLQTQSFNYNRNVIQLEKNLM